MRESKFGPALVVESNTTSGGYVLGFRMDPFSKLQSVTRELSSLYNIHIRQPEFGVQYSMNIQVSPPWKFLLWAGNGLCDPMFL